MTTSPFPSYIRASKKQLEYLATLCAELGIANRSLYERYTMVKAMNEITRLKKRLDRREQLTLF